MGSVFFWFRTLGLKEEKVIDTALEVEEDPEQTGHIFMPYLDLTPPSIGALSLFRFIAKYWE
jgi:hypothetical protein